MSNIHASALKASEVFSFNVEMCNVSSQLEKGLDPVLVAESAAIRQGAGSRIAVLQTSVAAPELKYSFVDSGMARIPMLRYRLKGDTIDIALQAGLEFGVLACRLRPAGLATFERLFIAASCPVPADRDDGSFYIWLGFAFVGAKQKGT